MTHPQLEDHLVGLELQLVELVESQQRAEVQGRTEDAARLQKEIAALQAELAATAEHIGDAEEQFEEPVASVHLEAPTAAERVSVG
jgi:predicted  nucleic acid-binding Zn-ribbon protein